MKIIKLQETQFGNDKLFLHTDILVDCKELLEGKPVEFEVVSHNYKKGSTPNYEPIIGGANWKNAHQLYLDAHKDKGKKLGTMKLELEMVAKGSLRGEGCNYKSILMNAGHKDTTAEFFISKQEYDFIKDNEYFKENDLVVVLKVSEVERYESE